MFWRLISALVVLFWTVMTGLIIRDTYFPDHSRFAEVPVRLVFDLFLSEAAAFNNTLHLYQGQEKIGHTGFALRMDENRGAEAGPLYALVAHGAVTVAGERGKMDVGFRMNGELLEAEHWQSFDIHITSPDNEMEAVIAWKQGAELPVIEVKKGGQVMMNTQMAQTLLESPATSGWLKQMLPATALPQISTMRLHAREGRLDLAGKQRRCYIVTATLMQGYEARLFFTELGELARVELPGGYRLIEPMMHGLEMGLGSHE